MIKAKEERSEQARLEWETIPEANKSKEQLDKLARKWDITGGKWIVHIPPAQVDQVSRFYNTENFD